VTEVQELVARLRLKDDMTGPLRKVRAGVLGVQNVINSPRFQKGVAQIGTGIRNSAAIAGVGLALLTTQVAAGLNSLIELEKQTAQTNAVIKSTGGIAGITAEDVRRLSEEYESLNATIGDETIREAQNLLLTFTNVRKEAFEPALAAILDMNTAMGKGPDGLQSTVIAVGKALNDPIRGITALRRVGVQFTKDQEAQIKALVETNDVYGAQQIILAELNKEFGGSFLAQGDTTAGKVAKFRDAIEDLQRSLATALLPAIGKVADALSDFLQRPDVIKGAEDLGKAIGDLFNDENLAAGGRIFSEVFEAARAAAPTIAAAAKITGEVVKTAVSLFRSLPPELQRIAIGAFAINKLTGGLVTNLASGLIGGVLKQLVSGVVNVRGATVIVQGGVGGAAGGAAAAGAKGGLGVVSKVFLAGAAAATFAVVVAELKGIRDEQSKANQRQASEFSTQTVKFAGEATLKDMYSALAGIEADQERLTNGLTPEAIAYQLNIDGVRDAVEQSAATLRLAIEKANTKALTSVTPGEIKTHTGLDKIDSTTKSQLRALFENTGVTRTTSDYVADQVKRNADATNRAKAAVDQVTAVARQTKSAVDLVRNATNAVRTTTASVKAATDRVDDAVERNITVLRNKKLGVRLYNTVSIRAQTVINGRVYQANVDRQNYYVKPGTVAIPE
jgi:hypothetical protein